MKVAPLKFDSPTEYTTASVNNRWDQYRKAWLSNKNTGADVHDGIPRRNISDDHDDLDGKRVKKTMNSMAPPYPKFPAYYPLEDTIDLYMNIWYDDSSSSDSSDS